MKKEDIDRKTFLSDMGKTIFYAGLSVSVLPALLNTGCTETDEERCDTNAHFYVTGLRYVEIFHAMILNVQPLLIVRAMCHHTIAQPQHTIVQPQSLHVYLYIHITEE